MRVCGRGEEGRIGEWRLHLVDDIEEGAGALHVRGQEQAVVHVAQHQVLVLLQVLDFLFLLA